MLFKNKKLFIFLVIIVGIIIICFLWLNYRNVKDRWLNIHGECLGEDEIADYPIDESYAKELKYPMFPLSINIKDKKTNEIKFSFKIDNVSKATNALEMYKCNIYVIKVFNFDDIKGVPLPNYTTELWRYGYNGKGIKLLTLFKKEGDLENYTQSFRVSPDEKYIVLEKGYLGQEDYSLVIKDLKTKENVFVLSANSISKKYPNIVGVFDLLNWSDNNRYFWGSISEGAYVNGYFRIDTQNWKTDIFEAPDGAMGGSDLNINTGYLTIQPGQVWTGFSDIEEELKAQYKKEGKKSSLYIYNLFTKKKLLVAETEEPLWWFEAKWISDTELEYKMPNGEKMIYKLK